MRPILLALCLAGCLSPPPGWSVVGGTNEQQAQAHGMIRAARAVSGLPLADGQIDIVPYIGPYTTPEGRATHYAGATGTILGRCMIEVLEDEAPFLARVGHELGHCWEASESGAECYGRAILADYRSRSQADQCAQLQGTP